MIQTDQLMRIGGITDMSTVDWYGNVSLVLFFAGCNLRCPYCQNSLLIPLDSGEEVNLDYLRESLETAMDPVPQLDAAVFTGGEPSLQPDAAIAAAELVQSYGLKIMLDTNGTHFGNVKRMLETGLFQRVALDVKAPLSAAAYGKVTGMEKMGNRFARNVWKTLELCKSLGVEVEARTTVVPGLSDGDEFIRMIAEKIKDHVDVYYLQQFSNMGDILDPVLKETSPTTKEKLLELARIAVDAGVEKVYIKTRYEGLERVT